MYEIEALMARRLERLAGSIVDAVRAVSDQVVVGAMGGPQTDAPPDPAGERASRAR